MIVVLGHFDFHPDDFAEAKKLAAVLMQATMEEDGCFEYAFAEDLVEPNRLRLGESWRDDAALSAHFLTPHIQAFREGLKGLRMEKRVVKRYEVSASSDL